MDKHVYLIPIAMMVALTIIVWIRMFVVRLTAMKINNVHPEKMKSQQAKSLLPEEAHVPAENFSNIFEVPILFYVLFILLYVDAEPQLGFLIGGYLYVGLRVIHSAVALTYNKVMHRFISYLLSCLVLWVLWIAYIYQAII